MGDCPSPSSRSWWMEGECQSLMCLMAWRDIDIDKDIDKSVEGEGTEESTGEAISGALLRAGQRVKRKTNRLFLRSFAPDGLRKKGEAALSISWVLNQPETTCQK